MSLSEAIEQAFVIAYKEKAYQLQEQLIGQGFKCQVLRQQHLPEYQGYSHSYLCLLNHRTAWQKVIDLGKPALICEADFVPVKNLAQLPLPYDIAAQNVGIAWLYTCAPQIYHVSSSNHAVGFSTSMVAYILTPMGAKHLLELANQVTEDPGPRRYSAWDSEVEEFLRLRKLDSYVPWRNYGEHGGIPNLEHKKAGLSASHRADVLYGPLAFDPMYVEQLRCPKMHIFGARLKARIKGIGRLVLGRYLQRPVLAGSHTPLHMLKFAFSRQFTWRP